MLVIGQDPDWQLAPFHEFESTGNVDEFVVDVDETETARRTFVTKTIEQHRAADGTFHSPYDDRFYRDPTPEELEKLGPTYGSGTSAGMRLWSKDWGDGRGYRPKVHYLPEGFTAVTLTLQEYYIDFSDYAREEYGHGSLSPTDSLDIHETHKYGYLVVDDQNMVQRVVRRTNPNARWDWYQVGGRYSGRLRTHDGRIVDSARFGDLDWTGMRRHYELEARLRYSRFHQITHGLSFESWAQVQARLGEDIGASRTAYWNQPLMVALREDQDFSFIDDAELIELMGPKEDYICRQGARRVTTFALVKDRQWYERGSMGWFGNVHGGITEAEWQAKYAELLSDVDPDTLVTMVDCHI